MSSLEPTPVTDVDRMRVAELLQQACGDGRLALDEFTERVGDAWAADTEAELAKATAGLAPTPTVGTTPVVDRVVAVFSDGGPHRGWRLRSGRLRTLVVFGTCAVDLREARSASDVIEVTGACVFGEVQLTVPEGVEVEIGGVSVFGSRAVELRPVPRVAGTPVVRVAVHVVFGSLRVVSQPRQVEDGGPKELAR